uniref:ATP synthase subunit delta n=1 Tax=uncultured bacterium CBNPD1 BAC clone 2089 TaxID=417311 RepID=B1N6Q1_9BACT|nr:putative ATP synthase delta chain [uncultured bacterium CBNPD1 BAC clone 2089]
MSEARIEAYARALAEIASAEGNLDAVEKELYVVARAVESNDQLRATLTDESIPAVRRQAVVEALAGSASNTTAQLLGLIIGSGRGRDLPAIIDKIVKRASNAQNKEVAEVRSAVALTADQQSRLASALERATGKAVNLKVVVDPSVLGGLIATVGDEVIDGSVRTRLDQVKSRL